MARPRKEVQQTAEVTDMEEVQQTAEVALNADGLIPGQEVDFATMVRVEAARAAKNG